MRARLSEIFVFGAGKVGHCLTRQLRHAGLRTTLRGARRGWPRQQIDADLVIIACRDQQIDEAAQQLAQAGLVGHRRKTVAVVHCAGALGPEVLACVRQDRVAVAQMHPLLSFASTRRCPTLTDAMLYLQGDAAAVRLGSALGRRLGMRIHSDPPLDLLLYHAAASLVAGGAAALGLAATSMVPDVEPSRMSRAWGPLLRSVAENLVELGLPASLTGPIRRGDGRTVQAHLEALQRRCPELRSVYAALARLQLDAAAELGEASPEDLSAIARILKLH